MPSTQKTPSNKRKKVTASARARISTRKVNRQSTKHLGESYIQQSTPTDVSTVPQNHTSDPTSSQGDTSTAIISMLNKLSESNQALMARIESIEERQNSDRTRSDQMFGSDSAGQGAMNALPDAAVTGARSQNVHFHAPPPMGGPRVRFPTVPRAQNHPQGSSIGLGDHFQPQSTVRADIQSDGIVPTLEALRRAPSISSSVTQLLESYEEQARASLQGRQAKKSGRYNTTDIVYTTPEYRWPNEGYHAPAGKKKVAYDDLTLPQWAVGQLSNIFYMSDPTTAKHALLQVILAMKDATSLPWPAVRGAWATSMHDLEEGHLGWQDATQWSINHLSSSQISMASSQASHMSQPKKLCKFYNEGTCSHDTSHGMYKHMCAYCDRQGKSGSHPENKCYMKLKAKDKQQNV